MKLSQLVSFLDKELDIAAFDGDYSNNGLQVEGDLLVNRAIFAVDASQSLFEIARERGAQFVFVHHGLSWGPEPRRLTGDVAKRYRTLFCNGISLYAAHLPLDANAKCGNNAELCRMLSLEKLKPFLNYHGLVIGWSGELPAPRTLEQLSGFFARELNCEPRFIGNPNQPVSRIAVCSGGGGLDGLNEAIQIRADLFLTGEAEHVMYHPAKEHGVSVLGLGHYASETVGPRAVMAMTAERFPDLKCEFVDLPTGF